MQGLSAFKSVENALNIISLGAGRQSSVMYLMSVAGEINPLPDYAIFADTGNEPQWVYEQVEYLQQFNDVIPIIIVSNGNIYEDTVDAITGGAPWGAGRWLGPPGYAQGSGPILRKCTGHYKIKPKERRARELMKHHGLKSIIDWRGHTIDEIHRAKPDKRKYYTVRWPLLEKRKYTHDCATWLTRNGHPAFEWSACEICPFSLNDPRRAVQLSKIEGSWQRIRRVDHGLRDLKRFGIKKPLYLNRKNLPVEEYVELELEPDAQMEFDCDGMCGL